MKERLRKIVVLTLALLMYLSVFPINGFGFVNALETENVSKVADPDTMDSWKVHFGKDTTQLENGNITSANAGYIWGDKTVLSEPNTELKNMGITLDDTNDFLVTMSALAANKEIKGYSAIPTDTMLILDLSGSMSEAALNNMVMATNDAINRLQELNYSNRVGVIVYAGNKSNQNYSLNASVTVLLPLDRYTGVQSHNTQTVRYIQHKDNRFSVINGVKNSANKTVSASKNTKGATYTQGGLWTAWKEFEKVNDVVVTEGVQEGTNRIPILVLMSDGAPTLATKDYNNVNNPERGDGTASSTTAENAFTTMLTASWVKEKLAAKYNRSTALMYTLGLNVGDNGIAKSVLDPSNATTKINDYWKTYLKANNDANVIASDLTVKKDSVIKTQDYVNRYFAASDANGLIKAFEAIVDEIILQSKYYPTLVGSGSNYELDGYITFTDELGKYMEVKDIKGILAGNGNARQLYSGNEMAQAIMVQKTFGNIQTGNMNNLNAEGEKLVNAIATGLRCTKDQAKTLLSTAIKSDQIDYTSEDKYSNYISWFADVEGNFVGAWDGHTLTNPAKNATYAVKSYGFLGAIGSMKTYDASNMMYILVQVRKDIETGCETVVWGIPASLIPLITYNISFDGNDFSDAKNSKMNIDEDEPIRLIYEAGLCSNINELNITEKVEEGYVHVTDNGEYEFFTNFYSHDKDGKPVNDTNPKNHDTTWLDYEPSLENERYYFIKDTYVLDTNHNKVKKIASNTSYSREFVTFVGGKNSHHASIVREYPTLTAETLSQAKYDKDGYAYIPKGTIIQTIATAELTKSSNPTDTLKYYRHPIITLPSNDNDYHIDAYLGNNGKLIIKPAQGIVIVKTLAAGVPTTNETFTFEVELSGITIDSKYPALFVSRSGVETTKDVVVNNNKITVEVLSGEKVYITGFTTGTNYTVSEQSKSEYTLKTINGKELTSAQGMIAAYTLDSYVFENALKSKGNLSISKEVKYPQGFDGSKDPNTFTIEVNLPENKGETLQLTNGKTVTVDNDGKVMFQLVNGETVVITGLTEGDNYTVVEKDLPKGYTLETIASDMTGTIPNGTAIVNVVNKYSYDPVGTIENPSKLALNVEKIVSTTVNKKWNETFNFELEYYDGQKWIDVDTTRALTFDVATAANESSTQSLQYDVFDKEKTLDSLGFVFTEPGAYTYRVIENLRGEVHNGVSYDANENLFTVYVTDKDYDGKLEIDSVTCHSPMEYNTSEKILTAHFVNKYDAKGSAGVKLNIEKKLANTTGITPSLVGFVFELVNGNEVIAVSDPTDESGRTSIAMNYAIDPANIDKVLEYTLREVNPTDTSSFPGVSFDAKSQNVYVEITHDDKGGVFARIKTSENETGTVSYDTSFTNTYSLDAAAFAISGTKTLFGRDMVAEEFTFELYEADSNFDSIGTAIDTVKNVAGIDGVTTAFKFATIEKSVAGTYHYIVREKVESLPGVAYDSDCYHVTVTVGLAETDATKLSATVSTVGIGDNIESNVISFENTFVPLPMTTPVIIAGGKLLNGVAATEAGKFTFELYKVESLDNYSLSELTPIQTTNDEFGRFAFDPITYTEQEVGKHYYIVVEKDAKEKGYTYDKNVYEVTIEAKVDLEANSETRYQVVAMVSGVENMVFENTYVPHPTTTVTINGNKVFTNASDKYEGESTFALYNATNHFEISGSAIASEKVVSGNFRFDLGKFTSVGPRYYVVKEVVDNVEGMTYDETIYQVKVDVTDNKGQLKAVTTISVNGNTVNGIVFTNDYEKPADPQPDSIVFEGTKELTGRELVEGEFVFELYKADETFAEVETEAVRETTNTVDGKFAFDAVYYNEVGKYYYVVKENVTNQDENITYDQRQYHISVDVTLGLDKNYKAEITSITVGEKEVETIQFNNEYTPFATTIVEVKGTKVYSADSDAYTKEATFFVYNANDQYVISGEALQTEKVVTGEFVFDLGSFNAVGKHYYVVKEDTTNTVAGMTYDTTEYQVLATVTNDNGQLVADTLIMVNGEKVNNIVFTNTYDLPKPTDPMTVVIPNITKNLNGALATTAKQFVFELYETKADYVVSGEVLQTSNNDINGRVQFEPLSLKEGIYYYVIQEGVSNEIKGMTYDTSKYELTVEVFVNDDNQLEAKTIITLDGEEVSNMVFNNQYEKPPVDTSSTDTANTWLGLLFASLLGFVGLVSKRRTHKRR